MELHGVRASAALAPLLIAATISLGGCVSSTGTIRANRDWYTLKEATNGRNMVLGSWRMCEADPSCSPGERAELTRERDRAQADYDKAMATVQSDHAHGWYADVNSLPSFARDPTLGLTP